MVAKGFVPLCGSGSEEGVDRSLGDGERGKTPYFELFADLQLLGKLCVRETSGVLQHARRTKLLAQKFDGSLSNRNRHHHALDTIARSGNSLGKVTCERATRDFDKVRRQ